MFQQKQITLTFKIYNYGSTFIFISYNFNFISCSLFKMYVIQPKQINKINASLVNRLISTNIMGTIKLSELTSKKLTKNFNPIIGKVIKDEDGFVVEIKDKYSGLSFWVDVWYEGKYIELNADWNQFIFSTDNHEDIIKNEFQKNCDNFVVCTSLAINFIDNYYKLLVNS